MNGPTFNIGYDPILSNPFPQTVDYSKEIDERVQYLQAMKERMSNTIQYPNNQNNSLWSAIDSEIGSLNDEQRNILFSDTKYIQIDNQLKQLVQEALINSVKNVIEQSPNGKELLTQQLNYIKSSKNAYDRRIRPLNKDVTMWDVYVALNAQYHDNIDLYEKWFSNANDSEIEEKIIEATIANWFEDEDASSDKVWEYFRVI